MTLRPLGASAALAALLAACPALADVTPEEVWQNWQDFYAASGASVTTGAVAREGDTLVVSDFKASSDIEGAKAETAIAEVRLRDTGDGAVEITMSEEAAFTSSNPAIDGGKAMGATGTLKMPGLVATVSGSVEAMSYAFDMPSMEMILSRTEDGQPAGDITILMSKGVSSYTLTGPQDAKAMDGSYSAASVAINLNLKDDTTDLSGSINIADPSGKITGNFVGVEEEEIANALAKGFGFDLSLGYGALTYDFDVTDASSPAKMTGGAESGTMQMALDAARLVLAGGAEKVDVTLSGAEIPFPEVKLSYAESDFNLIFPLAKSESPQDFAFLTRLVDLQVSPELWAMLDPTGMLPHDPATLEIDTVGTALVKSDVMATPEGATPEIEMQSWDVKALTARIAGAELTGAGAFTFDNTDMTTFDGMPAPTGKLELKLTGGNSLLDKLVGMGLVSDDQAMGARMMIAMFANPGPEGSDELTSVLEFKDKGFFANGQQLQ